MPTMIAKPTKKLPASILKKSGSEENTYIKMVTTRKMKKLAAIANAHMTVFPFGEDSILSD